MDQLDERLIKKFNIKIVEIIRSLYLLNFEHARFIIDELETQNLEFHALGNAIFDFYMGDFVSANQAFEKLYNLGLKNNELFYYWSLSLRETNETQRCVQILEEAVKLFPDDKMMLSELSKLYNDIGLPTKALEKLNKHKSNRGGDYDSYKILGDANLKMNNFTEAINFYSLALKHFPYDEKLMNKLRNLFITADITDKGIIFFKTLLKKRQIDRLPILYNLAYLYKSANKINQLSRIIKQLEEIIPNDYFAINYLLKILIMSEKGKKLKSIVKKYINENILSEIKGEMLFSLALVYSKEGKHARAKKLLEQALEMQPYSTRFKNALDKAK